VNAMVEYSSGTCMSYERRIQTRRMTKPLGRTLGAFGFTWAGFGAHPTRQNNTSGKMQVNAMVEYSSGTCMSYERRIQTRLITKPLGRIPWGLLVFTWAGSDVHPTRQDNAYL
jgi:CobQ-like glutamine amidotransferase family enzyme